MRSAADLSRGEVGNRGGGGRKTVLTSPQDTAQWAAGMLFSCQRELTLRKLHSGLGRWGPEPGLSCLFGVEAWQKPRLLSSLLLRRVFRVVCCICSGCNSTVRVTFMDGVHLPEEKAEHLECGEGSQHCWTPHIIYRLYWTYCYRSTLSLCVLFRCVHTYMGMHVWRPEINAGSSSFISLYLSFWDRVPHWTWSLLIG